MHLCDDCTNDHDGFCVALDGYTTTQRVKACIRFQPKQTHGGRRPGAGRKPRPDGRESHIIRVRLTQTEYRRLIENTTPDTRREILLAHAITD